MRGLPPKPNPRGSFGFAQDQSIAVPPIRHCNRDHLAPDGDKFIPALPRVPFVSCADFKTAAKSWASMVQPKKDSTLYMVASWALGGPAGMVASARRMGQ